MKKISKFIIIILIISLLSSSAFADNSAREEPTRTNSYINAFGSQLYANSDGTLTLSFATTGTNIMDKIGVSSIRIYKSDGTLYAALSGFLNSGFLKNNAIFYGNDIIIPAESGYSYYAYVMHYAARNGGAGCEEVITRTVYLP